ncbi:MAG: zf-HC2 domain-containing protein [Planctomycetes bacterium]|nr:zf-HC2 domain-containing protein [Planctomycetota bacterium]
MISVDDCRTLEELVPPYVEGGLKREERAAVEAHLQGCARCRESVRRFEKMQALAEGTFGGKVLSNDFDQKTGSRMQAISTGPLPRMEEDEESVEAAATGGFLESLSLQFGAAPWWIISGAFHALLILLVFLIGMVVMQAKQQDVVIVTDLEKQEKPPEPEKKLERDIIEKPVPIVQSEVVSDQTPIVTHEVVEFAETAETDNESDAHDTKGEDGISDIWLGGQGTVGSIGVGGGGRAGAFGRPNGAGGRLRRAVAGGGGKATESSVDAALAWLARHQEKDGSWDCDKYLDNKATRWGYQASFSAKYDPGITGLALLAFLGAGHSSKIGKYKGNVKAAIDYLLAQQGPDGDFTSKVKPCHSNVTMYCHCIATLALAEALAMEGGARGKIDTYQASQGKLGGLAGAVAKGVDLILKWQGLNGHGAWSYSFGGPELTGPLDPTATGWAMMALKSAKVAGIEIPIDHFRRASDGLKSITFIDKTKGDYGWAIAGYRAQNAMPFNSKGYACTAAMCVGQLFTGADRAEAGVDGGIELITQEDALPAWIFQPNDATTDYQNLYYWYYGTLACFQAGGDAWKKWNEKMKTALVPNQRKGGPMDGTPQDIDGSWDPNCVWSAWAGRVFSTSMGALCLEVYYRYLPIYRDK